MAAHAQPMMPISTSTSRYHNFRQPQIIEPDMEDITLLDEDGTALYETEFNGLLLTIIQLNDVSTLKRYLAKYPRALGRGDSHVYDPFWSAAHHGSTDALRVLLEHYAADPSQTEAPNARGYLLLNVACHSAQVNTARFLLDSQPAYGDIHARDAQGMTALLSAAASFVGSAFEENDRNDSKRDRVARGEELMQLLLDRGACARDSMTDRNEDSQPCDTVLSLAISKASAAMVTRLIDEGADVHGKRLQFFQDSFFGVFVGRDVIRDITPLHTGSFYLNAEGVQVLLDRRGSGIEISDMVSCRDSFGCLPLHWAAGGPGSLEEELIFPYDDIVSHALSTMKLMLTSNPSTINAQDEHGETPLHFAVRGHARCGTKHSAIAKLLLEYGADASLRGRKGQTPLHCLGFDVLGGEPIDPTLIALLLAHGANVDDLDADGNTPLYLAAKNLHHVEAVRFLVSRGANVNATDSQGNTPLHRAAGGSIWFAERKLTVDDLIRAQDEMMRVLQDAGGNNVNLMDQPNAAGRTPRQIREEIRNKWRESEEPQRKLLDGAGRGRGRGRHIG